MLKKMIKKAVNVAVRFRQTIAAEVFALSFAYMTAPVPVFAASYLEPLEKLKTVLISIVSVAGGIILIYGVVKFAESFQKKDQNGEYMAVYTIIAGGIMIGVGAVVNALT